MNLVVDVNLRARDVRPLASKGRSNSSPSVSRWTQNRVSRHGNTWGVIGFQIMIAVVLAGLSWSDSAHAYAWMIRHDYTACSTCHADPSGGELLTKYGRVTSDLILSMQYGDGESAEADDDEAAAEDPGPTGGMFWGALDLPNSLLLSGSYRSLSIFTPTEDSVFTFVPVMQGDLYGQLRLGSVTMGGNMGIGKSSPGSKNTLPAQVTTNPDGINLIARNYYIGADIGSKVVLRGGRLNLPFGVRIAEHTAWVREATRTDRESDQQHGLALAYVGENFRAEIMGIAGNYQMKLRPDFPYQDLSSDAVRERGYSMYAEGIAGTSFAAGVTSKVTYARLDRLNFEENTVRQAHGLTSRFAASRSFSLLAEMDVLFRTNASTGYVGFAQADWEPIQGLHLMLTGEFKDEGLAFTQSEAPLTVKPGLGDPQGGGWLTVDWFFFRQMELRTDLIIRQDTPMTILGQFHMYL